MLNIKKKTCLQSEQGKHDLPYRWSKPIKVSYQREFGSFGNTTTEYKYIQIKTCSLCGFILTTTMCYGNIIDDSILRGES